MDLDTKRNREYVKNMPFKQKLSHFWDYYRNQTIAAVVIAMVITGAVINIMTKEKFDLKAGLYINDIVPTETVDELKIYLNALANEAEEEEHKNIGISAITYETNGINEWSVMQSQKYIAEIIANINMLYILDDYYLNDFKENDYIDKYQSFIFKGNEWFIVLPIMPESLKTRPDKVIQRKIAEEIYSNYP